MTSLLQWSLLRVCKSTKVGEYQAIGFSDWNQNPKDDALFVIKTTEALKLIEQLDPRRFARIKRYIRYIQNTELYSGGRYIHGICQIDFGRYNFIAHPDWSLYQYAGTIIHEATHGMLHTRGIRYRKSDWVQIERICRAEQNRFLSRIQSPYGSNLLRPFSPQEWKNMGSGLTKFRTFMRRIKEEEQKAQQGVPPYAPQAARR